MKKDSFRPTRRYVLYCRIVRTVTITVLYCTVIYSVQYSTRSQFLLQRAVSVLYSTRTDSIVQ